MSCSIESHEATKLDDQAWAQLRFEGIQHIEVDGSGQAEQLELRTCQLCGSTLARKVQQRPCRDANCLKLDGHVGLHRARTIDLIPSGAQVTVVEWDDEESWDADTTTVTDARCLSFDDEPTNPVSQPMIELEVGDETYKLCCGRPADVLDQAINHCLCLDQLEGSMR